MAFSSPVTDLAQQVHSAVQSGRQDRAETDESVPWRQPMPHGRATKPSKVSATWPEGVKISGKSASASVTGDYRRQKNRSEVRSDLSRVQESRINAGGKKSRTAKAAAPEAASARETSRLPTPPNSSAAAPRAYNRLRKASTPIGVPRLPTPPQAT